MSKLRLNISMSLDGYVAGPNQSIEHPLGEGGEQLHEWAFATRTFRGIHGMEGGATGIDGDIAKEHFQNVGVTIMGRHMFGGGNGPWGDNPWNGWWGENPPYHTPVFVLTRHARSAGNAGRHHVSFRHRRHSRGTRAGKKSGPRQRRLPRRRRGCRA